MNETSIIDNTNKSEMNQHKLIELVTKGDNIFIKIADDTISELVTHNGVDTMNISKKLSFFNHRNHTEYQVSISVKAKEYYESYCKKSE